MNGTHKIMIANGSARPPVFWYPVPRYFDTRYQVLVSAAPAPLGRARIRFKRRILAQRTRIRIFSESWLGGPGFRFWSNSGF